MCRTLEVSRTRTKPQNETLEETKEVKPWTFTQLRLEEVLARKGSWSPTTGGRKEGSTAPAGMERQQGRKRKASGSPKGATKSPTPNKPSKTPPKTALADIKGESRKQGRQTPQDRPLDTLTPIRKRIREEGIVRKNLKRLEGGGTPQDSTVPQQTPNRHRNKIKTKTTDIKQTLLTKYILTKPRASNPASSTDTTIKEDSIPRPEGRGGREEIEEGTGDNLSQGKRQEDGNGSQGTERSPRCFRAAMVEREGKNAGKKMKEDQRK